ncbi:MAG: molybdopterin cofactor-binding domain-containing protein, partial [Rubrivivax sp.]
MSTPADPPRPAASAEDWPAAVKRHPRPAQWLRVDDEGHLEVRSGKVEIGQGIQRALARLVARELGWPLARVRVSHPSTATHPDEGMTSGSLSMQDSGAALRIMAAVVRERLCEAAARRWSVPREQVELCEARLLSSQGLSIDAAALLEPALLETPVQGVPPPAAAWMPDRRPDALDPSLTRRAVFRGEPHFIHDLHLPGLLHGRVLHPPAADDQPLEGTWPAGLDPMPGQVDAWCDGALFGVLAERPSQAQALLE